MWVVPAARPPRFHKRPDGSTLVALLVIRRPRVPIVNFDFLNLRNLTYRVFETRRHVADGSCPVWSFIDNFTTDRAIPQHPVHSNTWLHVLEPVLRIQLVRCRLCD